MLRNLCYRPLPFLPAVHQIRLDILRSFPARHIVRQSVRQLAVHSFPKLSSNLRKLRRRRGTEAKTSTVRPATRTKVSSASTLTCSPSFRNRRKARRRRVRARPAEWHTSDPADRIRVCSDKSNHPRKFRKSFRPRSKNGPIRPARFTLRPERKLRARFARPFRLLCRRRASRQNARF